ncbi:MAG: hypothetical protein AB7Q81_24060 [Gammaproteobacteria bacterium]
MAGPFYIPAPGLDGWRARLADPDKHWRLGYSARALATAWEDAGGFPPEIRAALDGAADPALHGLELLAGFPEHEVALPGGRRPSQSDIWLLARGAAGLVSIAVEGKVAEPFDKPVVEWLAEASAGKQERLAFLCATLGLEVDRVAAVRYQLLHRTASAILEARRFTCTRAVMLVHSFSQEHAWSDDFSTFAACFGSAAKLGALQTVTTVGGLPVALGWVTGDATYLGR